MASARRSVSGQPSAQTTPSKCGKWLWHIRSDHRSSGATSGPICSSVAESWWASGHGSALRQRGAAQRWLRSAGRGLHRGGDKLPLASELSAAVKNHSCRDHSADHNELIKGDGKKRRDDG